MKPKIESESSISLVRKTVKNNENQIEAENYIESVKYNKVFGDITYIKYTPIYSGVKEDIIITEYTGQSEFEFTLYTNGLKLLKDGDILLLCDENGEEVANFGQIIIFTADNGNNSFGEYDFKVIKENQEYTIIIKVDSNYLQDPKTVYPLTIDPTLTINYTNYGTSGIEDVTLNSLTGSNGSSNVLTVGNRSTYGKSRILMKFPALNLTGIYADQIISATVYIRDLMCQSENMYVYCYPFYGSYWSESSANWSNVNPDLYGSLLSYSNVYYNGSRVYYGFDISSVVRDWSSEKNLGNAYSGSARLEKGIIFKASSSIENGSTLIAKTFGSYNIGTTSYKPYLIINYNHNLYYSDYEDSESLYNNNLLSYDYITTNQGIYRVPIYDDSNLQLRANCYGYAIKTFYALENFCEENTYSLASGGEYGFYLQQPGEFANKSGGLDLPLPNGSTITIYNYNDLINYHKNWIFNYSTSYSNKINMIYSLIEADMQTLGYSVEEMNLSTIPSASTLNGKRLLALVVGDYDYHFYMQHSDNTWSHKPDFSSISNSSIDSGIVLTNSNIRQYAMEGPYTGAIKFFYITKNAVIDYGNYRGQYNDSKKTNPYFWERAGNNNTNALEIAIPCSSRWARFDYRGDVDYYSFKPTSSGRYNITIETYGVSPTPETYPITAKVISANNHIVHIPFSSSSGTLSLSCYLYETQNYYLVVSTYGQNNYEFGRRYKILISN